MIPKPVTSPVLRLDRKFFSGHSLEELPVCHCWAGLDFSYVLKALETTDWFSDQRIYLKLEVAMQCIKFASVREQIDTLLCAYSG